MSTCSFSYLEIFANIRELSMTTGNVSQDIPPMLDGALCVVPAKTTFCFLI